MTRKIWDVQNYVGQIARVKLMDSSSGIWGHINCDDLKGDMRCMWYVHLRGFDFV